ncbi:HAD family hydrolase [Thermoflexus sp.]|uniref:HAD family hydrolase n=1 Tax=Thermoflexus sp. TaxID=1969742 RepID=UPI0035E4283C
MHRAVIVDFGGVLVRSEDPSPREALAREFGLAVEDLEQLIFASDLSLRAQRGELSEPEFWQAMGERLGIRSPERIQQVRQRFFAGDRLNVPLVEALRQWKGQVALGLISNAWSGLREVLRRLGLLDLFDEVVISAEVGLLKPDPRIYLLALERLRVPPEAAAFVDDLPENVQAARALGLYGIHFRDTQETLQRLQEWLNGWRPMEERGHAAGDPSG